MIYRRTAIGLRCLSLVCCLWCAGCGGSGDGLDLYRTTNSQAGHEFVKTEQFLVPTGSGITIQGLDFPPGVATLSARQAQVVQQIFNSIEEITENTVGDTNLTRVTEFKKMEFEIRGFPDSAGGPETDTTLSEARAKAVMDRLTDLGTPAWRLKARGMPAAQDRTGTLVFVRTR